MGVPEVGLPSGGTAPAIFISHGGPHCRGLLKNDHGKARGPTAKSGLCTRYWTDVVGISARGSPWDPTDEQLSRVALRYLYVAYEGQAAPCCLGQQGGKCRKPVLWP